MTETVVSDPISQRTRVKLAKFALAIDRFAMDLAQHGLAYANLFIGIFVIAPFLAPAFMAVGWTGPADAAYFFLQLRLSSTARTLLLSVRAQDER